MKHWFLFILVISWFCFPLSGQQTNRPDWVKQHPVSGLSYIGIGTRVSDRAILLNASTFCSAKGKAKRFV
jgi:hypothetical protein